MLSTYFEQHVAIGGRVLDHDARSVAAWEPAAAAGSIVVGDDEKRLVWVDRRAVEPQVTYPARARGDKRARFVVARGLSDVDGVADAIDHIEIVAGAAGTEERLLTTLVGIDAAEYGRRAFEPFLERRAVNLNHP